MKNETKEIRYFSMFTGVGGFELGITNSYKQCTENIKDRERGNRNINEDRSDVCFTNISPLCVGFSEIDRQASELLKQKFPTIKNYGDATKINPRELPDFDLLCGGFPCQAFSIAGKRRGFQDTRGTLFFEIARIIEVKRPKFILLENVKGLLNHNKGETFSIILQTISELGYDVQWMVLNSKFFGVPQNRERVFIIGSIRGTSKPEVLPFRESNSQLNERDESKIPTSQSLRAGYYKGGTGTHIKKEMTSIIDLYNKKEHSDRSPSLTEPHHNTLRVREGMKIRRLTPIECERLQGFPDNWTEGFSDTQRYKMMGNAVTVNVIKAIVEKLI